MNTVTGFTTEFKKLAIRQSVNIGVMVVTAFTLGIHNAEAVAPLGVKLMVQPWDPIKDDDSVMTLYDSNDAITSAINSTWNIVKPKLINSITTQLSTPNLLAEGVSLYGVKLNINTPELSIAPDGNNAFVAKLLVRDTYLEATSTTPDIALGIGFGSYADSRCSIRFSLELTLKLGVTDDKARMLEARYTPMDTPVLLKDFKADSQNVPCDIAKFLASDVAKLLVGKDFWKWMTDEINNPARKEYRELNDAIKQALNAGLVPVNAQLNLPAKYAQYAKYARIGLWANKNKLTVLFGVRELPLPARTASATGRLKIGDLKGLALPINGCDQLRMSARVKTGPRVVIDPFGSLGEAPMVAVGKLRGSALAAPATGQSCDYTVDQLVPGFPNLLRFNVSQETMTRNRDSTEVYVMGVRPEGWAYDKALHPQPSVGNLNLTLLVANAGAGGLRPQYERIDAIRQDPLTDAGVRPNSGTLNTRPQSGALINQGNAVSPAATNPRASGSVGARSPLNSTPLLSAPSTLSPGSASQPKQQTQKNITAPAQMNKGSAARLNPQPLPPESVGVPNTSNGTPR
jgi:hypothetical protein